MAMSFVRSLSHSLEHESAAINLRPVRDGLAGSGLAGLTDWQDQACEVLEGLMRDWPRNLSNGRLQATY